MENQKMENQKEEAYKLVDEYPWISDEARQTIRECFIDKQAYMDEYDLLRVEGALKLKAYNKWEERERTYKRKEKAYKLVDEYPGISDEARQTIREFFIDKWVYMDREALHKVRQALHLKARSEQV